VALVCVGSSATTVTTDSVVSRTTRLACELPPITWRPVVDEPQYFIGEKGEEVFVPKEGDTVIPNDETPPTP
jgi:hypothetical protein